MSFLSTVGKDIKGVFSWLGSPKGQAVIATAGAVVSTIDPALAGIVGLTESWITKVISTEALAVAAGAQDGSGATKAAAVLNAMTPEITKYFPTATSAQLEQANTALVAFLNALGTPK